MINFDSLPSEQPNMLAPDDCYLATIKKAEIRISKNSGNPYLNVEMSISKDKKSFGTIYDIFTESENPIQQYKLRRLIEAVQIPLSGNFELKDLTKVLPGKQLWVDVTHEEKEGQRPRNIVNVFDKEIYYPVETSNNAPLAGYSKEEAPLPTDDDLPFDVNSYKSASPSDY